ncbi:MAG: D-aminoacyl-tRNA deacylase [Candidatus Izemoplasmatales bacterium]|jgi:D-tyrosyl-tRNA(Tyr) deacylase|nr:D-aminoacyl-tRNA deacylase [Candidatus Izemoplasmatales bacterium]
MRVVVQRVSKASVKVNEKVVSAIDNGFLLLVGFTQGDGPAQVSYVARKISRLRVFEDEQGLMNLDINQVKGKILSISQFTVYGDSTKSNRPSFTKALNYEEANKLYLDFNKLLSEDYNLEVHTGVFGEHMDVELVNSGPVTIIIEKE